jgi:HTH-type transcriptional regulator / antitoxin HigA
MQTFINQYNAPIAFHPGDTLAEKLEELSMGPKEFALRTGKPEKTIIAILKGKSSITPEMAIQFEHALQIPAHFWLNKQRSYDDYLARKARKDALQSSIEWAKMFPYDEMVEKEWLPAKKEMEERTSVLLSYFGFSDHQAWVDYYYEQELKIAFSLSLKNINKAHAVSAWLRKGELQASEIDAPSYVARSFRNEVLPAIKDLMEKHHADYLLQLQSLCLKAGVKVIYTPSLSNVHLNVCSRWLKDTPIIQMSRLNEPNNSFWLSFFQKAGHILLHGKKDIFLEKGIYPDFDQSKEEEADLFAMKWTYAERERAEILKTSAFDEETMSKFAHQYITQSS